MSRTSLLTTESQEIQRLAINEARRPPGVPRDGHLRPCDAAHLLIGILLKTRLPSSMILAKHHVNLGDARFVTHSVVRDSKVKVPGNGLHYTASYTHALAVAGTLMERDQRARINTAHLLGGIVLSDSLLVKQILQRARVTDVRILNELGLADKVSR